MTDSCLGASSECTSASPIITVPSSSTSIWGNGMNEKNCAIFYPVLASGRFFISPGLRIDSRLRFFSFKSRSSSPLVLMYRKEDEGSPPDDETRM